MARGRMISKSLSTSTKRKRLHAVLGPPCAHCGGSLAEFAQALYPLLVAHTDDWGRLAGDVDAIAMQIDPASPRSSDEVERALQALVEVGLIVRWVADDGRCVLAIVDFDAHQLGLHKRTASKLPEPPPPGSISARARVCDQNKLVEREQALSHNKLVGTEQEQEENKKVPQTSGITRNPPEVGGNRRKSTDDDPPLDVWLADLQSAYPPGRVTSGYLTSSAFHEQFRADPRPAVEVWRDMRDGLDNQLRGREWRVERMIPSLDKWLREGRWRQRHEVEPAAALTKTTRGTLAALDSILREGKS